MNQKKDTRDTLNTNEPTQIRKFIVEAIDRIIGDSVSPHEVAERLGNAGIHGSRTHPCHCPLAKALKYEGVSDVEVWGKCVYVGDIEVRLPEVARQFVERFGAGSWPDLASSSQYFD